MSVRWVRKMTLALQPFPDLLRIKADLNKAGCED